MAQDGHRTFYKRALPSPPAIGFSTPAGRILFQVKKVKRYIYCSENLMTQYVPTVDPPCSSLRLFLTLPLIFWTQEALSAGTMESFFPLSEQFSTQAMPAFCGLASLAMVLNALQVDPKRVWQGSWRCGRTTLPHPHIGHRIFLFQKTSSCCFTTPWPLFAGGSTSIF